MSLNGYNGPGYYVIVGSVAERDSEEYKSSEDDCLFDSYKLPDYRFIWNSRNNGMPYKDVSDALREFEYHLKNRGYHTRTVTLDYYHGISQPSSIVYWRHDDSLVLHWVDKQLCEYGKVI